MTTKFANHRIDGYISSPSRQDVPTLELIDSPPVIVDVDLRPLCSPVESQGEIGSCTANALGSALEYLQIATGGQYVDLSRLFIYYNARRFSEREHDDCGATMEHVMASLIAYGACPEEMWPYDHARWNLKPYDQAYTVARKISGLHYASVSQTDERKYVLMSGLPIVFGMGVPPHLLKVVGDKDHHMPPPRDGRWEPSEGGHAMLIVGFSDQANAWLVRNSWGTSYGDNGYVWIDYAVMDHYAGPNDFWTAGPLDRNKFFRFVPPAAASAAQGHPAVLEARTSGSLTSTRADVRADLETHLNSTRKGLRDRLRGPGVGGGYDKGPGVGGGYDKGPGAGGGYDKGPGAGGGYDD